MIQKILLATDGSKHAERAAEKAVQMAKQLGNVPVTLFHVTASIPTKSSLIESHYDVRSMLEERAHTAIIRIELMFRREQSPFEISVALGDPAEEIIKKADEEQYDLLIVGRRGLNRFQELVMGSVSYRVAHEVHCPVMIVK